MKSLNEEIEEEIHKKQRRTKKALAKLVETGSATRVHIPSDGILGDSWVLPAFDDTSWAGALRRHDRLQGFGQGADLVDLDQHGVGNAAFDAFDDQLGIGAEDIVADEL